MQVKPLWPGVVLALIAAPALAGPAPAPSVTPQPRPLAVPAPQAVVLNGKPFPVVTSYAARVPAPSRTFFVAAKGENGDGSERHPWNDLQTALVSLAPGDRLRVLAGDYAGAWKIDESCRDGSAKRPIQVSFDGKAMLAPRGDAPALTIRRAHWHLRGVFVELEQSGSTGVSLETSAAHDVTLDGARISGGAGPSVLVGAQSSRITIANSRIAKTRLEQANPQAVGIAIAAGARDVLVTNNRLRENPGGSLRVQAPEAGAGAAGGVRILGNTIHGDAAAAIEVQAADGLRIAGNTISDAPGLEGTKGVSLGRVDRASVQNNVVSDCAVAIQVGQAVEGAFRQAGDVSIDHNYIEDVFSVGTGIRIEAARGARVVHNVLDRVAEAIVILGTPPRTEGLTVADNLAVGVSRVAFRMEDPKSARLFDYNVFSPAGASLDAWVGQRSLPLDKVLKEGAMRHTRQTPGVRILNRDLARIAGVDTVDQGTRIPGMDHRGAAPDIGVEER